MQARGFEVDLKRVQSDYLYQISGNIYQELDYYHGIRGVQEICNRKDMKLCLAKYLDFYKRTTYRPKKKKKTK